jgi:hypothetical protein
VDALAQNAMLLALGNPTAVMDLYASEKLKARVGAVASR